MALRHDFREQLNELQRDILRMGTLVEEAIALAVQALRTRDVDLARRVVADDDRIDQFMYEMEQRCLSVIALQQPIASDLRLVGAALKIITDLERMADHAVNMAKVTIKLEGQELIKPLVDIPRMAELAQQMTRSALEAYVHHDAARAEGLSTTDHQVDALYKQVFAELEALMARDPAAIHQALQLLLVARDLERLADHATNLGEWVIYMATGQRRILND